MPKKKELPPTQPALMKLNLQDGFINKPVTFPISAEKNFQQIFYPPQPTLPTAK